MTAGAASGRSRRPSGFLATKAIVSSYSTSPFLVWAATRWAAPVVGWRAMLRPCGQGPGQAGGTPPPKPRCRRSPRRPGRPAAGHESHFALPSFCGYPLVANLREPQPRPMHFHFDGRNRQAKSDRNLLVRQTLVSTHQERRPVHLREFLQSAQHSTELILHFHFSRHARAGVGKGFVHFLEALTA